MRNERVGENNRNTSNALINETITAYSKSDSKHFIIAENKIQYKKLI